MALHPLQTMLQRRAHGEKVGVTCACTAHPIAIEACIEVARDTDTYALIEATANQVDQYGGYTGLTPADFAQRVRDIAENAGLPAERLILGGDHLGPLVWSDLPETEAMARAEELVRAYVQAGFTKIHLDTSMRLADDDPDEPLTDETIARRSARLALVAEETFNADFDGDRMAQSTDDSNADFDGERMAQDGTSSNADFDGVRMAPVYVIGSEVPIPGGAHDNEETVSVTTPEHFAQTYEAFEKTFAERGLEDAFERIVAVVVQPGVEFSDATITDYNRDKASALCARLAPYPTIVFEGHSTDYQMPGRLRQMVEDGIAILKVGPALTFALRQALFALSDIEDELLKDDTTHTPSDFKNVLLDAMWADPKYWKDHYHNTDEVELNHQMLYSLSDRCRYYLSDENVRASLARLIENIDSLDIPLDLLKQHLPQQYRNVKEGNVPLSASALVKDHIKERIADYLFAIGS